MAPVTRTDFEVVRAGSSAAPWAVRHIKSGDFLPYYRTVTTRESGTFRTSLLFHRLKRDAVAALDEFLSSESASV